MERRYYCNGFRTDTHSSCCQLHDNAYGKRGLVDHLDAAGRPVLCTRAQADAALRRCAIGRGLNPALAWVLWAGLRLGGWLWWTSGKTGTPINPNDERA